MKNILRAAAIALALGCSGRARAIEIDRITMGRATYPAKAVVLGASPSYTAPSLSDPSRDTLSWNYGLSYGASERLNLAAGLMTLRARRDLFAADRLEFNGRYLIVSDPAQVAPFLSLQPSLRGESMNTEFGAEALKNVERWSAFLLYEGRTSARRGRPYGVSSHKLEPGLFYRFGLSGLIGAEYEYQSEGTHSLDVLLGGRISKNLFLGVEQAFGLNPRAERYALRLQLKAYFGRYSSIWDM